MRRDGFTLPETVVALSLFAVAATALCQAAINAQNGLKRLERKDDAHTRLNWIRDDILSITDRETMEEGGEIIFPQHVRKKPKEGDEEEESDREEITIAWDAEIFPTPLLDVHKLVISLDVEQGQEKGRSREVYYYVYRPGWYEEEGGREDMVTEKQDAWEREQMDKGL